VHHSERCDQAGGISASYSEGFWLKSLPTVQLFLHVFTIIGKCQDIISNLATTASFHILSN
jgi:hypothetical protein